MYEHYTTLGRLAGLLQEPSTVSRADLVTQPPGYPFSIMMVSVDQIHIDRIYQRPLEERRVAHYARRLNMTLMLALHVNRRRPDIFYCFDGQHRLEVLKRTGQSAALCYVFDALSIEEEAAQFEALNSNRVRHNPSTLVMFHALIVSKDPIACAIAEIVQRAGFFIPPSDSGHRKTFGGIICVQELRTIYLARPQGQHVLAPQPERLKRVLNTIKEVWDGDTDALRHELVGGLTLFLDRYGDAVDWPSFVGKLRLAPAVVIVRRARARSEQSNRSPRMEVADEIRAIYDKGKRSGRLAHRGGSDDSLTR